MVEVEVNLSNFPRPPGCYNKLRGPLYDENTNNIDILILFMLSFRKTKAERAPHSL